jgi:flagellar motor protein MotB
MPRLTNRRTLEEDDEGFYVSMSDMLTGLLFIFIILLVYYAVNFKQKEERLKDERDAKEERAALLDDLERRLNARGIPVEIVKETGVLRLSDAQTARRSSTKIMFQQTEAKLTPYGKFAVAALADELAQVLPCYVETTGSNLSCKTGAKRFKIDVLLIEGHSDKRGFYEGGEEDRNLELSADRAISTYKALIEKQPGLDELRTTAGFGASRQLVPILSVSGYGGKRPRPDHRGESEADFAANRRIDLRFLMASPDISADSKSRRP